MKLSVVYVVTAYRFGDRARHSYLVGVFRKKAAAEKAALAERELRGSKYRCEVLECPLDTALDGPDFKVVLQLEKDDNFSD